MHSDFVKIDKFLDASVSTLKSALKRLQEYNCYSCFIFKPLMESHDHQSNLPKSGYLRTRSNIVMSVMGCNAIPDHSIFFQ